MRVLMFLFPVLVHLGGSGIMEADDHLPVVAPAERSLLEEVRADFTIGGKPIHPMILDRFVSPRIGPGPEVLAVDVEAAMQNVAHCPPPVRDEYQDGYLTYRYKDGELGCFASYALTGTLDDGTVVLRTRSNYGGTHTTLMLVLVQFDWRFIVAGEKPRLEMRLAELAHVAHTDRVEVKDHWVEVYPKGRDWPTVISP